MSNERSVAIQDDNMFFLTETQIMGFDAGSLYSPFIHFRAQDANYDQYNKVDFIPDISGNDIHAMQTIQASKPDYILNSIGGYPSIAFYNGPFLNVSMNQNLPQPTTYFVVGTVDANNTTHPFIGGSVGQTFGRGPAGGMGMYAGTWRQYNETIPIGFSVFEAFFNGTSSYLSKNLIKYGIGSAGTAAQNANFFIGKYVYGASNVTGYNRIAEILVFNRVLPEIEREGITNYLMKKYGLV